MILLNWCHCSFLSVFVRSDSCERYDGADRNPLLHLSMVLEWYLFMVIMNYRLEWLTIANRHVRCIIWLGPSAATWRGWSRDWCHLIFNMHLIRCQLNEPERSIECIISCVAVNHRVLQWSRTICSRLSVNTI